MNAVQHGFLLWVNGISLAIWFFCLFAFGPENEGCYKFLYWLHGLATAIFVATFAILASA